MKASRALPLLRRFARVVLGVSATLLLVQSGLNRPASAAPISGAAAVVQTFVDAYNKHDLNGSMALIADNFVEVFPDGNVVVGKDDLHSHLASVFAGSPHVTMIVDHLVGDDYTAAAQVSIATAPPKGQPPAAQY